MYKKTLIITLFVLLALPLATALTYSQNKLIDLKIPCTLDGYPCSASAACNITSQYPDSTYLIENKEMTNLGGGEFNYTVTFVELGNYPTKVFCQDNGQNATSTFGITITPSGFTEISQYYWLIIVLITAILGLGFWIEDAWILTIGSFGLIFLGFLIITQGIDFIKNTTYTYPIGLLVWALAIYIIFKAQEEKLKEGFG